MHGRRTIGASPACPASQAMAIERLSTSSTERSLSHAHDGAVGDLNQSIRLSPNYAFAHYSLAFVQCQTGDPGNAIDAADIAAQLSPLDPMMFGTYRVRTFALLRLGKIQEAADCAALVGRHAGDHFHAHAV